MLIHDLVLESEKRFGSRPSLIRGTESLTYSELAGLIRQVASGLHEAGVGRGDRVGIYLNKRFECVTAYFAVSYIGAVFVPINAVLKPAQVGHILRDCNVKLLIAPSGSVANLHTELSRCDDLEKVVTIGGDANKNLEKVSLHRWEELLSTPNVLRQPADRIDNDVAAILYTSGSTGKPKGVVLSHRNMVCGAKSVSQYLRNEPEDRILSVLPFSFDAGFSQLTTAFASGASVILLDYLVPKDVLKTAESFNATGLTGVPPLWNQLVTLEWPDAVQESLRYIANTGGAMPTATLDKLRAHLPNTEVFLMYGLTESFRSTYLPPAELDARPTSIGKAIPNAEILVVREDGSLCGPGEPGELVHRGALVSLGYWNDPEKTRARFKPLPGQASELTIPEMTVWSGDTVVADEDGFLFFVGRNDDMIKSSGYRISPSEVEEVVHQSGEVEECVALGIPHPVLDKAVVIVATGPSSNENSASAILAECRRALPNYMVPHEIRWVDQLPRNPNGKVDRKKLVEQFSNLFSEES
jgi:acyl-CoA ligase (AMP-forming) (exosortase A-associated)